MKHHFYTFIASAVFLSTLALTACTDNKTAELKTTAANSNAPQSDQTAFTATSSAIRKAAAFAAQTSAARAAAPKIKYNAGESPDYAKKCGWPVNCPPPAARLNPAAKTHCGLLRQSALKEDGCAE